MCTRYYVYVSVSACHNHIVNGYLNKFQFLSVESNDCDCEKTEETSCDEGEAKSSHYYHKYDLTRKGASGQPVKPDIVKRNKEKESAKTAAFVHTFIPVEEFTLGREQKYKESIAESKKKMLQHQRVVEVAAAEQHVALPYTIVDVSTIPHDVDPDSLDAKPQAPDNPPMHPSTVPRRTKPKTALSGHGTTPSPAKRQDVNTRKHDVSKAKEDANDNKDNLPNEYSLQKKEDKKTSAPVPTILYDDDHHRKDKVTSPNSQRKVAILIPSAPFPVSHVYEDIDDESSASPQNVRKNDKKCIENKVSPSVTVMESSRFDTNMQAIAKNLDLKKEKKSEPTRSNSVVEKQASANNEAIDAKQEKGKKLASGGKGFLSRFFSKGSKSEEPQLDGEVDNNSGDKEATVVAKELEWTRSQSVDCGSVAAGSPVCRVRKSVIRSESTKEQSALQSELKNVLVKSVPKTECTVFKDGPDYQNTGVKVAGKGSDKNLTKSTDFITMAYKSDVKGKPTASDPKIYKKPEVAGKPDKLKKPEKAKKPETPACDKKISVKIEKPSVTEKPQISPPRPVSPVKPKPTRRSKSGVEQQVQEGVERMCLTCDTSEKFIVPESPVSPG